MQLSQGQRTKIADLLPQARPFQVGLAIQAPGLVIDFACFGLDAQGRLSDERYMTFFNQPRTPCGGVQLASIPGEAAGFALDLERLPASIDRLCLTAALDGPGTMSGLRSGHARLLDDTREVARFAFTGADFDQERALMLLEFYRKDGIWRLLALGQGFNGGLAALVRHFGGSVADEPAPSPAPPTPPPAPKPPVSLNKITLEKSGNRVSLEKQGGQAHGEILINLNWTQRTTKKGFFGGLRNDSIDLDLGCLIEMRNGVKGVVQALGNRFGDYQGPPYIRLDADDRTGARAEGENLRINGQHWDEIQRVLVFAFIYQGVPNWAEADARISLKTPGQPEIEVRLDGHQNDRPMCGIALLENQGGAVCVTKLVDYHRGHTELDRAHHWGLRWVAGSKD